MDKQMMSMEELKQVAGGNMFTDAWDWVCDQLKPHNPLDDFPFLPDDRPFDFDNEFFPQ